MSHIPGVMNSFKDEWKKADKNVKAIYILGMIVMGLMVAIGFGIYWFGEFAPDKYELLLRIDFLVIFVFFGWLMANLKFKQASRLERELRVKKGLRYTWDEEDLDELEERVRKLEEKKWTTH